jgi:hypothetical protein
MSKSLASARVRGWALAAVAAVSLGVACVGCASAGKPMAQPNGAASQTAPTHSATASTASASASAMPSASPAASPSFGAFTSWQAAQSAAGFGLLRPASTNGLPLIDGGIQVGQCAGDTAHAAVVAIYAAGGHELGILQDDEPASQPCSNFGEATTLGTYSVHGALAQLLGACGTAAGEPSCDSASLWLSLGWTTGGDRYYQVLAHNESRAQVLAFAQGLSLAS